MQRPRCSDFRLIHIPPPAPDTTTVGLRTTPLNFTEQTQPLSWNRRNRSSNCFCEIWPPREGRCNNNLDSNIKSFQPRLILVLLLTSCPSRISSKANRIAPLNAPLTTKGTTLNTWALQLNSSFKHTSSNNPRTGCTDPASGIQIDWQWAWNIRNNGNVRHD